MFAGEKSTSYLEKVTNAYPRLGQVELVNFKAVSTLIATTSACAVHLMYLFDKRP